MGFLDYFRQPDGLVNLTPDELAKKMESEQVSLIDVRTRYEYNHSHIGKADSHPLDTVENIIPNLNKNVDIVLICATGHRSRAASNKFLGNGFTKVSHLEGGMRAWKKARKETVSVSTLSETSEELS